MFAITATTGLIKGKAKSSSGSNTIGPTDGAIKLARSYGIDLSTVIGTGAQGRIIQKDVQKLIPKQ